MRDPVATLRAGILPGSDRLCVPRRNYEAFLSRAWQASRHLVGGDPRRRGTIPILALRRAMRAFPASAFDEHVLRMERNEIVYLIPPFDVQAERDLEDSLKHPDGSIRSFLCWMRPKSLALAVWD
jgi:hypothetical protein